jgi:hypothetical protein
MAKKQSERPRRFIVVSRNCGPNIMGMTSHGDLHRTVPEEDGKPAYRLRFEANGQPLVIDDREIEACQEMIDSGGLLVAHVSPKHLEAVIGAAADATVVAELASLRKQVAELTEKLADAEKAVAKATAKSAPLRGLELAIDD